MEMKYCLKILISPFRFNIVLLVNNTFLRISDKLLKNPINMMVIKSM